MNTIIIKWWEGAIFLGNNFYNNKKLFHSRKNVYYQTLSY